MGDNSRHSKILEVSKITGYGQMYCLRALKETTWDVEKAVKYLKEHPPIYIT